MSSVREPAARAAASTGALRHVLLHLITPLVMCLGMGLAYLSAFVSPQPHEVPVAVVGSGPQTQVLAQTLKDRAGDALDVRTVADRGEARELLRDQELSGAFVPDADRPELLIASAASDMSAIAVQKVFTPLAAEQGAPLTLTDVATTVDDDPTGQGLFFLLVAVSIGGYASVAVVGGAGGALPMRLRALLVAGVSLVVSLIGTALAGPVFHLAHHSLWAVWGLSWLYAAGILAIGTGLHTFLKRWTTLAMMVLFVMLNFTSSGGLFLPHLQNGFFGSLHAFWNGAGFVEGLRSLLYFDHRGLSGHIWTLVAWLAAGVLALLAAALHERRTRRAAAVPGSADATEEADTEEEAEEEMEESVAV